MNKILNTDLIAPCGMNCGICVAFFGYTMSGKKRKHPCDGCRSRASKCAFIKKNCDKLASEKIEYCFECTDFPCEDLKTLDKRYRKKIRNEHDREPEVYSVKWNNRIHQTRTTKMEMSNLRRNNMRSQQNMLHL